jgi:hypothetical protein
MGLPRYNLFEQTGAGELGGIFPRRLVPHDPE